MSQSQIQRYLTWHDNRSSRLESGTDGIKGSPCIIIILYDLNNNRKIKRCIITDK